MSALKNFGITFLVSALIFGVVAYFAVGFFSSTVSGILNDESELEELFTEAPQDNNNVSGDEEDPLPQVEGESFTVLFALTDKREELYKYLPREEEDVDDIDITDKGSVGLLTEDYSTEKVKGAVLMRVCKESGEYTFIPVPVRSKVYTQCGGIPLEDVMYRYGRDYFVQKIAAMTGIVPDYSVIVNITEMDDIVKEIGSFVCHVGEDIYTDGKEYYPRPEEETTVLTTAPEDRVPADGDTATDTDAVDTEDEPTLEKVVSAGNVTIGHTNVEAVLLFENYENGQTDRSVLLVDVLRGIIGNLSRMDADALGKLYEELTEDEGLILTDMTQADLERKAELLGVFAEYDTVIYSYPGTQKGDEFIPDIDKATLELLPIRLAADATKGK